MTEKEEPIPSWAAVDVVPLGPNFLWAVRLRSALPAEAAHPWKVVKYGICQSEWRARSIGELTIRSIAAYVLQSCEELCVTGTYHEEKRAHTEEGGPVPVGYWRSNGDPEVRCIGLIRAGGVDLFWDKDLDAWELARAASAALLGKPLDIFEEST